MRKEDVFEGKKVYELGEEWQKAAVTKKEGEACRHRLEKRWYRRMVVLNFLIIIGVIAMVVHNWDKNLDLAKQAVEQMKTEMEEEMEKEDKAAEDRKKKENRSKEEQSQEGNESKKAETASTEKLTEEDVPLEISALLYGLFILVGTYFMLYYYHAYYCSNSVRITEKNFKEVYDLIEEYSRRLGIKTPKAYVVQQSGVLNAFATFIFRRQWICIHAELFEVAYREHKDMDALAFVIAHELAHIYYGHATLHYVMPILFAQCIPPFRAIASRTREYSCDRLAQRLVGTDGLDAMLALVVDRHLYKMVDKQDYIEEMRERKGFFLWIVNMFADHPIMNKRILALVDGKGSGRLY